MVPGVRVYLLVYEEPLLCTGLIRVTNAAGQQVNVLLVTLPQMQLTQRPLQSTNRSHTGVITNILVFYIVVHSKYC